MMLSQPLSTKKAALVVCMQNLMKIYHVRCVSKVMSILNLLAMDGRTHTVTIVHTKNVLLECSSKRLKIYCRVRPTGFYCTFHAVVYLSKIVDYTITYL